MKSYNTETDSPNTIIVERFLRKLLCTPLVCILYLKITGICKTEKSSDQEKYLLNQISSPGKASSMNEADLAKKKWLRLGKWPTQEKGKGEENSC